MHTTSIPNSDSSSLEDNDIIYALSSLFLVGQSIMSRSDSCSAQSSL